MKFYALLIIVIEIVSINGAYSQGYIPMINDSLYWDVAYAVNDPHPCAGFGAGGPVRYAIGNDTTLNATIYKQITGYTFQSTSPSGCPPFFVDTIQQPFDFYIREDVTAKKVYRFNTTSQSDELLFDFSLQQNDSILLPSGLSPNIYFYVDTLYTIITNDGVSRKYFECLPRPGQGTTGGFYIEGLGGAMGPFERPYNLFEEGYWVLCISDLNESSIYGSTGNCFNFTTDVNLVENIEDMIKVYPTPAADKIKVDNIERFNSYSIVNIVGMVIQSGTNIQNSTINITNLSSGIYYIMLEADNNWSVAKFIKQ